MSDIYRIAVQMVIGSNAEGFFAGLSKQFNHAHGEVRKLEQGFNRLKLAIGGGIAIAGGVAILAGLNKVSQHGIELLDQQDKMIRAGRTHAEVAELTARAYERVAKAIPTAAASDILRVTNQLAVVTGDLNSAERAAPVALKVEALLGNVTGHSAEGAGHSLYRAIEMKGLTAGDAANQMQGQKLLETFVQNIAASGGKLTADDFQQLGRRGGAYFKKATSEFLAGPMSVFAADVGGSTAGTTMATFGQFLSGATQMSEQQFETLAKLDMLDMTKVHKQKNGGFNTDAGAIHGSLEHSGDFFKWMQEDLLPAFKRKGIEEGPERDSMMGKIGRNRNTLRMMTMFSDPEFVAQITKDIGVFRKALGLDKAYETFSQNDPKGVREAFDKQEESMLQAIGAPLMQNAIPVMRALTTVFSDLGAFANAHGDAIKALGIGVAGFGAALVGGGGVAILAAIGPAGWLIGGIAALGGALMAVKPGAMKEIGSGILTAWDGILHLDFRKAIGGIGTELQGAFNLLPDQVRGAILSAIAGIAGIFRSAVAGIGSAIGGLIPHIPQLPAAKGFDPNENIGALPQAYHGAAPGGLRHDIRDRARSNSVPAKSGHMTLALTNTTNLDGRKLAENVTKHQVAMHEFVGSIGGHDDHGSYYPAGATTFGA